MITPEEIKEKANRLYEDKFLPACLKNETFFPLDIPSNKGKSTDLYGKRLDALTLLLGNEKSKMGYGYTVKLRKVRTRSQGEQSVPERIYFETKSDFLKFLKKEKEFKAFEDAVSTIRDSLPELDEWMIKKPLQIIGNLGEWENLMEVCEYFKQNPMPEMYIRELPIKKVDTKFIEKNKDILRKLLDVVLSDAMINTEETSFEKRFGLKYKEELRRMRILDSELAEKFASGITDISVPISEFASLNPPCQNVFIVENKMNLLTFPKLPKSIVIFGSGFAAKALAPIEWLKDKSLIYWGDNDTHGFQILSLLRSHFPQTISLMMDMETFDKFETYAVKGTDCTAKKLNYLTSEENQVFLKLLNLKDRNRLEQERIPHDYAIRKINELYIPVISTMRDAEVFFEAIENPPFSQ